MTDSTTRLLIGTYGVSIKRFRGTLLGLHNDLHQVLDPLAASVTGIGQETLDQFLQERVTPAILEVDALTLPAVRYVFIGDMSQNVCTNELLITLTVSATDTTTGHYLTPTDDVIRWVPLLLGTRNAAHTIDRGTHPARTGTRTLRTFTLTLPHKHK